MNKLVPIDLSLAQRLAAVQLENPFCGFCRAERAAVEELKSAMTLSPTGRLPSQPTLHDEPVAQPGAALVEADFSALELRMAAHFGADTEVETCQQGRDYRSDGDGIWLRRGFLSGILRRTGEPLKKGRPAKLIELPELAAKAAGELEQAQATIKEMGDLIDQQAAELEALRKLTAGATLTHKTKGGYYRPLGDALPAGAVKTVISIPLTVYQDTMSGQLYYRSTHDFAAALEPV